MAVVARWAGSVWQRDRASPRASDFPGPCRSTVARHEQVRSATGVDVRRPRGRSASGARTSPAVLESILDDAQAALGQKYGPHVRSKGVTCRFT